jgi:hypothetical protein
MVSNFLRIISLLTSFAKAVARANNTEHRSPSTNLASGPYPRELFFTPTSWGPFILLQLVVLCIACSSAMMPPDTVSLSASVANPIPYPASSKLFVKLSGIQAAKSKLFAPIVEVNSLIKKLPTTTTLR